MSEIKVNNLKLESALVLREVEGIVVGAGVWNQRLVYILENKKNQSRNEISKQTTRIVIIQLFCFSNKRTPQFANYCEESNLIKDGPIA